MKTKLIIVVSLLVLSSVDSYAGVTVLFQGSNPDMDFQALAVGFSVEAATSDGQRMATAQLGDLEITKLSSPESPALFLFAADGRITEKVTIATEENGDGVVIEISNVQINKFATETLSEGSPQFVEKISLSYTELCLSYGVDNTACWGRTSSRSR